MNISDYHPQQFTKISLQTGQILNNSHEAMKQNNFLPGGLSQDP